MDPYLSNPKRVLVVDDDESMLDLCARVLGADGFEVALARNGEEALARLADGKFGAIFTDLTMPGMDGMEVLKYVKHNHPSVCVNIVTGAGSIEGAVECMRLGACDFIAKPFSVGELAAMAFRCLGHRARKLEVERLKRDISAYEELDRMKSEFVSNVSHELRTPLFSMGGALELLRENVPELSSGTALKLCDVLSHNLSRLNSIVSNVLNFSRIEKGSFRPSFRSVDLAALARKALEDLQPLFARSGICVGPVSVFSAPASIEADPDQLEQVLINLLGNAIKFTPRGGEAGITISGTSDGAMLCVWDTGRGIPPEYHLKIFDRFYQVDGSMTRDAGGSGIGLSIVKAIVEMHGGRVWVESSPAKGARMNVFLPAKRSALAD
ncbi:MAG TPA: ATP-binding protein [Elusimicrobiales bacterium]|nr:ATP-binding protein [Elusimicrobiales bacterium]